MKEFDRFYWFIFQTSNFPIRKIFLPLGAIFFDEKSDRVKSSLSEDSECSWSWFSLFDILYKMKWIIDLISENEIASEAIILNIRSIVFLGIEKLQLWIENLMNILSFVLAHHTYIYACWSDLSLAYFICSIFEFYFADFSKIAVI